LTLESKLSTVPPAFKAPGAADISLRMLLPHTSGFPNPDSTPGFYNAQFKDESGPVNAALRFCSGRPVGEPGARFAYNNCDTLVLQAVLERLTGQPYARLVQDAVATPLGLAQLSLTPARRGAGSVVMPKGYVDANTAEPAFNIATFGAGGALRGTPLV
jgi:CubicO group peptidase (beta-lactamase class C family)